MTNTLPCTLLFLKLHYFTLLNVILELETALEKIISI